MKSAIILLAGSIATVLSQSVEQCHPKFVSPKPMGLICDSPRAVLNSRAAAKAIVFTQNGLSFDYCAGICLYNYKFTCKSFTTDSSKGNCTIYNATGNQLELGPKQSTGTIRFSNANCVAVNSTSPGPLLLRYFDSRGAAQVLTDNTTTGNAQFNTNVTDALRQNAEFFVNCDGYLQLYKAVGPYDPQTGNVAYAKAGHQVVFAPYDTTSSDLIPMYCRITSNPGSQIVCQSSVGNKFWNCREDLYIANSIPHAGCAQVNISSNALA